MQAVVHAYGICEAIEKLLGHRPRPEAFEDSQKAFNIIAKDSLKAERSPQVDSCALREGKAAIE